MGLDPGLGAHGRKRTDTGFRRRKKGFMEKGKIRVGSKIGTGTVISTGLYRKVKPKGRAAGKGHKRIQEAQDRQKPVLPDRYKQAFIHVMRSIPKCIPEHRFHPKRKWRFDFAIPERMIAFEYEGIFSRKSRHTTISGFTGDCEKYNEAQLLGWKVFRFTAKSIYDAWKIIDYYQLKS